MTTKDLGMVTAYAYAVMGGYEGTEAEFEALLGNIATDLEEIENLTVVANTLPEGSSATASYADGVLTLGIPKGDTGATGAGATATVGTTTTGNPGTNASVTNSGTTKDAVFNFTIPRGNTGNGIESIYLTGTSGAVKTYTILFTDGTTTTFDVTDGEVTNASLAEVLEDYAKTDGAYESMTVGNAEQLISSVTVNDKVPYNFRTSGGSIDIGNREVDKLVGGTVAWNQLQTNGDFASTTGISAYGGTASVSDNVLAYTVTALGGSPANQVRMPSMTIQNGHKVYISFKYKPAHTHAIDAWILKSGSGTNLRFVTGANCTANTWNTIEVVAYLSESTGTYGTIQFLTKNTSENGYAINDIDYFKEVQCIDLTQMFGSTIADYIYSLETATAGAGVAWFKKLFPKDYYAYNAGQLISVKTSAHQMVGFNAWDEEWEVGSIDTDTGAPITSDSTIRTKNFIPCVPEATYYGKTAGVAMVLFFYDANKNYLSRTSKTNNTFMVPADAHFIKFRMATDYGTTYNHDICINLSWDGERDGDYEAYKKWTYPLDSDLELRGIPKLDSANNLYYDGDTYEDDGTVARKYGIVTYDGSNDENWYMETFTGDLEDKNFYIGLADGKKNSLVISQQFRGYAYGLVNTEVGKPNAFISPGSNLNVYLAKKLTSVEALRAYLANSPLTVLYELAEPTTEEADPYQNPQIVDDFGTEEYVDERTVAIPVGHDTEYMNNLKAKLEMAPDSPDGDGDYIVRQTNGENSYVPLMKELPSAPSEDGTYTLKCTVASGTATLSWESEE